MTVTFGEAPQLPSWLEQHFPFQRRMARVNGHDIHFVDHGEGPAVLLFHGNPTWSFLWRKVIHALAGEARIIAPDLFGLGLSDKPRSPSAHSLEAHIATMHALVEALDLGSVVIAGQDWGGPVSMGVASRLPEGRVRGVLLSNTAVIRPARPFRPKAFHRFSQRPLVSDLAFRVGGFPLPVLDRVQGDPGSIGALEKRAYRYPLRRMVDRAAPLGLARMVPDREEHPSVATLDAIGAWVERYAGPVELVWGTRDPILGKGLERHARALPSARVTETPAGHFLQEEVPDELAAAIARLLTISP